MSDTHYHFHTYDPAIGRKLDRIIVALASLTTKVNEIMATNAEFAAAIVVVKEQLVKAAAEINSRIAALEEAINNAGNSTPEMDAALADLKLVAQALDDINPDVTPTP